MSAEHGHEPLLLTLFFTEAKLFDGLATHLRRQSWCVCLSVLTTCAALWQLLNSMGLATQGYILAIAIIGLRMLIVCRLSLLEKTVSSSFREALLRAANAVLSLASISSVFFGMSHCASHSSDYFDRKSAGVCFAMLSIDLSPAQRIELFCVLSGLILLTILYVVTLALFVPWDSLDIVALVITAGGGINFGSGFVRAVFRDRLLTLPNRVRQCEGIFRVFSWR